MSRPSWDQYFMGLAHYVSVRSHDTETKVGCLITNDSNHIVSMGYNGFCSGTEDENLPTTRPEKYPFMIHAEQNAISNLIVRSSEPLTAYITHLPCYICAKLLWQNSIRRWVVEDSSSVASFSEKDTVVFDFLVENGLSFDTIKTGRNTFENVYNSIIGE